MNSSPLSEILLRATMVAWAVSILTFMVYWSTAALDREGLSRSFAPRPSGPATAGTLQVRAQVRACEQEACPFERRPDIGSGLPDEEVRLRGLLSVGDDSSDP